jgi:hypothetical protein
MSTWVNADGVRVPFGQYHTNPRNHGTNRARGVQSFGAIKQLEIDYDLTLVPGDGTFFPTDLNNDGTPNGFTEHDACIPARAAILRAYLVASETAAGGTTIDVGLFQAGGTVIDVDALYDGVATADMAVGEVTAGNGALVLHAATLGANRTGVASVGANDAYVSITAAGTFTAGKGRIVVEYFDPLPRS